jgi:hypothetical protein
MQRDNENKDSKAKERRALVFYRQIVLKTLKLLLILVPFVIGFIGYLPLYNYDYFWSVYSAVRLYGLETDLEEINFLVELARWLAPFATAGAVITLIKKFQDSIVVWFKVLKVFDSYAVHGDSVYAFHLREKIGKRSVNVEHSLAMKAVNQIIIFDKDKEAIEFYNKYLNGKLTQKQRVYIHLNNAVRENLERENRIHIFNLYENCARIYWQKYPIFEPKTVVIIGFTKFGQKILEHGLLQNTFSIDKGVEYHIFVDSREYRALHYRLDSFAAINMPNPKGDAVYFHTDSWYENLDILDKADRIILCNSNDDNIAILSKIKSLCPMSNSMAQEKLTKEIYIRTDTELLVSTLFVLGDDRYRIIPFGTTEEICSPEYIINENLFNRAKRIHEVYIEQQKGKGSDKIKKWESLPVFQRYSNVSQADHIIVKLKLLGFDVNCNLLEEGLDENLISRIKTKIESLEPHEIAVLSEIEHIRWSKYHYLCNWEYSPVRCDAERKHNCLRSFADLSDFDKRKDFAAYEYLAEIIKN